MLIWESRETSVVLRLAWGVVFTVCGVCCLLLEAVRRP